MNNQQLKVKGLLIIFALAGLAITNSTQAWLMAKTATEANQFVVGFVDHEIEEEFNQSVKTNVSIKNTGNVAAFVRVRLVPSWQDGTTGDSLGLSAVNTYDIQFNQTDWFEKDGYWYCRQAIASGQNSSVLVYEAKPKANLAPEYQGKKFNLAVISQSIQADPITAVNELWQLDPTSY